MNKKELMILVAFIGVIMLVLGVFVINQKGESQKTNAEAEEVVLDTDTNYPVSSYEIVDKQEKEVIVYFKKDGREGSVLVHFDIPSVTDYFSQKAQNTLNGIRVLELQGINQIRFSPDLDKEIREAIFK